jgi:hypothetical protein
MLLVEIHEDWLTTDKAYLPFERYTGPGIGDQGGFQGGRPITKKAFLMRGLCPRAPGICRVRAGMVAVPGGLTPPRHSGPRAAAQVASTRCATFGSGNGNLQPNRWSRYQIYTQVFTRASMRPLCSQMNSSPSASAVQLFASSPFSSAPRASKRGTVTSAGSSPASSTGEKSR